MDSSQWKSRILLNPFLKLVKNRDFPELEKFVKFACSDNEDERGESEQKWAREWGLR